MLDIKTWLAQAGEPVADTAFTPGDAPELPYVCFLDSVTRGGGDTENLIRYHALTVERYSEANDDNAKLEELFDEKAIKYKKEKQWLDDDQGNCFLTTYDFESLLTERG